MKRTIYLFVFLLLAQTASAQNDETKRDLAFLQGTKNWFAAWQLVSSEVFKINKVKPVEFVFFDDQYVYSTSAITIPKGLAVKGNNLMNLKLTWRKSLHHDTLTLPDRTKVPVGLMSFASEVNGNAFFVMPLLSFWQHNEIKSKELGTEKLVTGVFLHEFSHSQQMENFGKKISSYENTTHFEAPFSDDIVQHLFGKNEAYISLYKQEVSFLYSSVKDEKLNQELVNRALETLQNRQQTFFRDKLIALREIDRFFLTMEGLGQYTMYLWLIHPKGGNVTASNAVAGVRRGSKWWSQDEGFGLFLVLDRLTIPSVWAKGLFGDSTEDVISLIKRLGK